MLETSSENEGVYGVKVSIIDDAFTGWTGHNAAYNFSICDELAKRSIACQLFVHRSIRDSGMLRGDLRPIFKQNTHTASFTIRFAPGGINRLLKLGVLNFRHFVALLSGTATIENGDIVLVAIESRYTSFAYGLWFFILSLKRVKLNVVFIVHNVPSDILKWEMLFVRTVGIGHHVAVAAHTEPIKNLCEESTGARCYLLPLPFKNDERAGNEPERTRIRPVVFAYLGAASFAKGFDIVVQAIDGVADKLKNGDIKIAVQCNVCDESAEMAQCEERLLSLAQNTTGIDVMKGALSAEEYYEQMKDADVVLIPNRGEFFAYALSGVFTESLARGKPVIVSDDTYMAKELVRHGGGMTFRSGNAAALAETISNAAARIGVLRNDALIAQRAWADRHNPERFVDEFIEIIRR
jgi:glycosyltransferase involved in cell wall biosynthesis